ncbi:MAG: 3'-5' exonuclease [Elusimicrobiota bacterium]
MKLFFADTETTGLDPRIHEVFQFSFIIEIDGEVVEEADIKMRPERPDEASPEALKVTNKTIKELLTYPERGAAFKKLTGILGRHVDRFDRADKLLWVGQNPSFDMPFVRAFFREQGDKFFGAWWDNRPADLISLGVAMKMRGRIDPENFKLGTLCEAFGVPLKAHDALEDVRATRAVFHKMLDFIPEAGKGSSQLTFDIG